MMPFVNQSVLCKLTWEKNIMTVVLVVTAGE